MSESTLKTRDWAAKDAAEDIAGGGRKLTVTGEVYVPTTNAVPHLAVSSAIGENRSIRLLDLTVSSQGIGGDAFTWKSVRHEEPVSGAGFEQVDILTDGRKIADVKVQRIPS